MRLQFLARTSEQVVCQLENSAVEIQLSGRTVVNARYPDQSEYLSVRCKLGDRVVDGYIYDLDTFEDDVALVEVFDDRIRVSHIDSAIE